MSILNTTMVGGPSNARPDNLVSSTDITSDDTLRSRSSSLPLFGDHQRIIHDIKSYEWTEFKAKRRETEQVYTIDALIGEPAYFQSLVKCKPKAKTIIAKSNRATNGILTALTSSPTDAAGTRPRPYRETTGDGGLGYPEVRGPDVHQPHKPLPERIRINSFSLNAILHRVSRQSDSEFEFGISIIHLRPFKLLYIFEKGIRKYHSWLKGQYAGGSDWPFGKVIDLIPMVAAGVVEGYKPLECDGSVADNNESGQIKTEAEVESQNQEQIIRHLILTKAALRDLEVLVSWMDRRLLPHIKRARSRACKHVSFKDLWFLFQPGDLLWRPSRPSMAKGSVLGKNGNDWTAFRVRHTTGGRHYQHRLEQHSSDYPEISVQISPFVIDCYYLDFNGRVYGPNSERFTIESCDGDQEITSLAIYPLEYAKECDLIKSNLIRDGKRFQQLTDTSGSTRKHTVEYYSGWTLPPAPNSLSLQNQQGKVYAEEVESQVIIDTKQTLLYNPDWIPKFSLGAVEPANQAELREIDPKTGCSTPRCSPGCQNEWLVKDDLADLRSMERFVRDRKLTYLQTPLKGSSPNVSDALSEEETVLLPNRVFGFVLRTRRWACLDMDCLKPIQKTKEGFKDLKLPRGHKKMVEALVQMHSRRKSLKFERAEEETYFDLVSGKGNSLIILLHGAPGVGKTSTAECIAEADGKPLLPITCGDLGITPEKVERELEEKFRLAQQWDCVLLLDEADVFLAERTRNDLKRNSLVSVFLRVLEYYSGILFLTTNRVGSFDEAFKSRIHLPLYYPPLDKRTTIKIWRMNLKRILQSKQRAISADEGKILAFAEQQFEQSPASRWNGRQIRNAFQTAAALAEFEAQRKEIQRSNQDKNGVPTPVTTFKLKVHHFQTVKEASAVFEHYIEGVAGTTAADSAYKKRNRNDSYTPQFMEDGLKKDKRYYLADSDSSDQEASKDDSQTGSLTSSSDDADFGSRIDDDAKPSRRRTVYVSDKSTKSEQKLKRPEARKGKSHKRSTGGSDKIRREVEKSPKASKKRRSYKKEPKDDSSLSDSSS